MKERFALGRKAYVEPRSTGAHAVALAGVYRSAGRLCLLGAAVSGSVDIVNSVQRSVLPTVTLRTLFDLSPNLNGAGLAHVEAAIGLAVDSPLWVVLLLAAAIPYGLAVERFIRAG
jgi:hypothetical protein